MGNTPFVAGISQAGGEYKTVSMHVKNKRQKEFSIYAGVFRLVSFFVATGIQKLNIENLGPVVQN